MTILPRRETNQRKSPNPRENPSMSLESLIATGTKLWLDSVDPELVVSSRAVGATGATSNPVIVSDLIKSGRFDQQLRDPHGGGVDGRGDRLADDR